MTELDRFERVTAHYRNQADLLRLLHSITRAASLKVLESAMVQEVEGGENPAFLELPEGARYPTLEEDQVLTVQKDSSGTYELTAVLGGKLYRLELMGVVEA